MKYVKNVFNFLLIFLIIPLYGQNKSSYHPMKDPVAFSEKFKETIKNTQTLKIDFVQERHLKFLTEDIESKGTIQFKKPNLVRLEYKTPFAYILILKNDKVMIKDQQNVSTFNTGSNKMFRKINDLIIGSISGDILNNKEFKISYLESDATFVIELFPLVKELNEKFDVIKIYVNKQDYRASKFVMEEKSGDFISIIFKESKVNNPIEDKVFSF